MTRLTFLLVGLLALVVASGGAAFAARGGPDAGGYTYIDSNDPAGPIFSFQDISAGATDIGSNCDDCVVSNLAIGFPFALYGATYSTMNVSSNGNVQFTTSDASFTNTALPYANFGPAILPFWDDLQTNCTSTDAIFTALVGQAPTRIRVIQWRMTPHFPCQTGDISFQALLFEGSNHVQFNYPDTFFATGATENAGASATVGVQSGSIALQYSFNTPSVVNNLAVCYMPPAPAAATLAVTSVCNRSVPRANPNIGAAIGAIVAGADGTRDNLARQAAANAAAQQAAAAAVAAASAPPAGGAVLRPPSTGDAGLLNQNSDSSYGLVALAAVLGLTVMSAGVLRLKIGATQR